RGVWSARRAARIVSPPEPRSAAHVRPRPTPRGRTGRPRGGPPRLARVGSHEISAARLHGAGAAAPDAGPGAGDLRRGASLVPPDRAHRGRVDPRLISEDRKSTRLNSSHVAISYAVFCLKKKKNKL